ncbi:MAG: hypothetical protein M0010_21135 [Actinomycetota bacterium]|jgi:hypothetical protein|nr:hypothetical protein [Actinomycetota bacterium]
MPKASGFQAAQAFDKDDLRPERDRLVDSPPRSRPGQCRVEVPHLSANGHVLDAQACQLLLEALPGFIEQPSLCLGRADAVHATGEGGHQGHEIVQ